MSIRPTPPFRFKQFTVQQSRSAMKVGFDGILLGAWAGVDGCERILDVGTGTGLVALMLAQRTAPQTPAPIIDAIEIDDSAVQDAAKNFASSPWMDRLRLIHERFQSWAGSLATSDSHSHSGYDLIVSNPPYFQDGRSSHDESRAMARHDHELSINDLLTAASSLLISEGRLSLILPSKVATAAIKTANEHQFYCRRRTSVRALPAKAPHRELMEFYRTDGETNTSEMTIEETHHVYTESFRTLARDFYLKF